MTEKKLEETLSELVLLTNNNTDKNTLHSYVDVYEKLFKSIRLTATRVMEIGVFDGGSIDMWSKYFLHAEIHGVDIDLRRNKYSFTDPRIMLHSENAYSSSFVNTFEHGSFDVIIDDGPHTLESMIQFVQLYPKLLKQNGLLIIEDVQSADWIPEILKHLPIDLQQSVIVFDRRHIKGRYDDIQIVVRNSSMIGI
jgi:spermidine synthase